MSIRENFPEAGSDYMDGISDGWEYQTSFTAKTLQQCYDMLQSFLEEEGYGDLPKPADAKALKLFQSKAGKKQLNLFEENGYIHNPIKILFPKRSRGKHTLFLHIYNEDSPQHLLRFHKVLNED